MEQFLEIVPKQNVIRNLVLGRIEWSFYTKNGFCERKCKEEELYDLRF